MCLILFSLPLWQHLWKLCVETVQPQDRILGLPPGRKPPSNYAPPTMTLPRWENLCYGKSLRLRVMITSPLGVCFMFLNSCHIHSELHQFHKLHLSSSLLLYMSFFLLGPLSELFRSCSCGDGIGTWKQMKMYKALWGLGWELIHCHFCPGAMSQSKVT